MAKETSNSVTLAWPSESALGRGARDSVAQLNIVLQSYLMTQSMMQGQLTSGAWQWFYMQW
ncbi:hypothetical protein LEMLEM_LOCUS7246 [Lemmus lemmus]